MNKAITDGLVLTPPAFENGLDVWSSQDGTPGSDTYDGAANAAFVPADADFGGCLELIKTEATQTLRYMGETPLLPGCYLQIKARVKAISGNLPAVRIAAWAGGAGSVHVPGLTEVGASTVLSAYGDVVEITAIVGTGARPGVDMPWGTTPLYGHFGLDLTGSSGGVIRIDDIEIEDVTGAFLRTMMDWVDVKDFGAIGDGVADDTAAFEAADAAANGRDVLVSSGTYYLADHVTFENRVRFEGTLIMPSDKTVTPTKNYEFGTYVDAFGGDELEAFKKAVHSLFTFSDHDSLDLQGRRIALTEPIDMSAAAGGLTTYAIRRVIRNGQFDIKADSNWDTDVVTSTATYSTSNDDTLTSVTNVANIQVGSLVQGAGVGREVYVREVNVGAQTVTLSQPLYGAAGTQTYTFSRFKYVLDFSGFASLQKFVLSDIEFQCSGIASGILLAPEGLIFAVRDCFITKPKDRGITSHGRGCQGMLIDRCQFLSNEQPIRVQDRTTIAMNANANDVKIRDNRVVKFAHFTIMNGTGHLIQGNHWFLGDGETDGIRNGGLVFTTPNLKTTVVGNYIDNNFIEWTNEHDATPDFASQYSFGGLTITGNIFTANDVAPWFNYVVIKPYGVGHYIHGLNMSGNVFRVLNGNITRVDYVDETFAALDMNKARNVVVQGNTFNSVDEPCYNPVTIRHEEASDATDWYAETGTLLPFGGLTKSIQGIVPDGRILTGASTTVTDFPFAALKQGPDQNQVRIGWNTACRGEVHVTVRMDVPI